MDKKPSTDFVDRLCPHCGLCCNGVLFADVELRKADDARRLADAGLSLFEKGPATAFHQPCSCFDGQFCRIYPDRPVRCRTFECGLLKRAQAGQITVSAALKRIDDARRRVQKVQRLVRRLGQNDGQMALAHRYARAMSEPVDLSGARHAPDLHGNLLRAFEQLMQVLQRDFLK